MPFDSFDGEEDTELDPFDDEDADDEW